MSTGVWMGSVSQPRLRSYVLFGAAAALSLAVLYFAIAKAELRAELVRADPDAIFAVPHLSQIGLATGRPVFLEHCSVCHGRDGRGSLADGVPDLRDRDWLYGVGRVSEIEAVVRYGIRSGNPKGWNLAAMPAYASLHPYASEPIPPLSPREVDDIVQLLLRFEGNKADDAAASRGRAVYAKAGCWDCHGADGYGDTAIGAPNLRDSITLFGGSREMLTQSIEQGRRGTSPAFAATLDAASIRAVAIYVASLSRPAAPPTQKASQ